MNERMRVLELLNEGKVTVEQAAQLLAALDDKAAKKDFPFGWTFPKKSGEELKQMTAQFRSAMQQHLDEFKKNIDFEDWSFKSAPRVLASVEKNLDAGATHVSIDTKQGRVRAARWDGDHVRIQVKGYVRADSVEEARSLMEQALDVVNLDGRYELSLRPTRETGEGDVDVFIPDGLKNLRVSTQNGPIRIDEAVLGELTAETQNGGIVVYQTQAERMRLLTKNGNVDIQHSIQSGCRSVYARTHNGTIDIDGIASETRIAGTAKSTHGRIEISGSSLITDHDHGQLRQHARFRTSSEATSAVAETQLFCETHHGLVIVRA